MGSPTLSVVVPATDQPITLERCVEAIRRAADPPDEVIVVHGPPQFGPAAARNAGAAQATGSVVVFIDSDVLVHRDVFTQIRELFAAEPDLTAVFGSYDDRASDHGTVSTFRNLLHHYVHHTAPGAATTFWAGLGALRREAFLAVDGFDDERFHVPSVEDIDLGLRLSRAGARIELDPRIQGTHLKHWRLAPMVLTDIVHRGVPWTAMVLDRGAPAVSLNLTGRHLLGAVAFTAGSAAVAAGRRRALAAFGAAYLLNNTRFYALLLRSGGPGTALAGVPLLALHNASSLAAAPLGVLAFARRRVRPPARRAPRMATVLEEDAIAAIVAHPGNGSRNGNAPHAPGPPVRAPAPQGSAGPPARPT